MATRNTAIKIVQQTRPFALFASDIFFYAKVRQSKPPFLPSRQQGNPDKIFNDRMF
jgi:hypothetical protein